MTRPPTNATAMPREADLVEDALNALRERIHIDATLTSVDPLAQDRHPHDAQITLVVNGEQHPYVVECKALADRRVIAQQVKQRLDGAPQAGLLITPYVSREIASYCREIDLQFIDTHGNAYLKGPGLFVYVAGERREEGRHPVRTMGSIAGVAGLRVVFALLSSPDAVAAPYREIAGMAGVSLGAVSNAIEDLERRGYVLAGGAKASRQLLDAGRLLEEWALNYPIQLKPRLNGRRYSVPNTDWWKNGLVNDQGVVWSGDVAAQRLSGHLKPATQTLYIRSSARAAFLKTLVMSHHAKPDPAGTLEVLDQFWGDGLVVPSGIAPLALVYADLMASLDPRAAEAAQMLRKEWTDGANHPA